MTIPTECIGSLPRPQDLISHPKDAALITKAIKDTIQTLEGLGATVITDGEMSKPSFVTYPLEGISNLNPDGAVIPFADGHTRTLPTITKGPFKYSKYAVEYLNEAKKYTSLPVKQAVISPSAMSLLYPATEIQGYSREQFTNDIVTECVKDIKQCLDAGAHCVQIDATELRLSLKLDPSGSLLLSFISLISRVLEEFQSEELKKIGVHICPGADQDSTHSLDIDYSSLLKEVFSLKCGRFYMELAAESDRNSVIGIVGGLIQPGQRIFFGVTDPIDPVVETPQQVCDLILEIARTIPVDQIGTCDDCGFSPFSDDNSTARETAIAKIRSRIEGTKQASKLLGL